jgi:dihydrodipicolinate synthase/N-acetylneuraminate lyase
MKIDEISANLLARFRKGMVIPAHPLALDSSRRLDERRQRALSRYYIDAGAGGLAVGVHTTQFEIRNPKVGLFEPVLQLASETIDDWSEKRNRMILKIAGICGNTRQAVHEAEYAVSSGYHAGLLSLGAMAEASLEELNAHCRTLAGILPIIGFYLQPAVGGRILPYRFWREFAEIENILAIKIAPFNRYQTLDVIRAVCDAGREKEIALYTGNDDNIVIDLLTEYRIPTQNGNKPVRITGGLLGHWAVWTKGAVELLEEIHDLIDKGSEIPPRLLSWAVEITDANAAFFDAANHFSGCIAGIHEVLRRQSLLEGIECLNPNETLSAGQAEEIDRVYRSYPHLADDEFVHENLEFWLRG